MLIEGNALKIRTIRSILVKSGDIGQNFRTLSFSERCFDTQTIFFIGQHNMFFMQTRTNNNMKGPGWRIRILFPLKDLLQDLQRS